MKRECLCLLLLCLVGCSVPVQDKQEITVKVDDATERKMMLVPMGNNADAADMTVEGNTYRATMNTASRGFYDLVAIKGQSQSILPLYVPVTEAKAEVRLAFGEKGMVNVEGSEDNQALAAYYNVYGALSRSLWSSETDLTAPTVLNQFVTKADSILELYDCTDEVTQYMKIWSYINAYDNYTTVQRLLRVKTEEMPYRREDVLPEPHKVLDTPLAVLFTNTPHIVFAGIPNKNNLDSALIYLDTHYNDTALKSKVKNNIAERYVTRFNYADGFEKGLERLQKATEVYGLDPSHAERFAKLKATIPGQPFPENVILKDAKGNVVDFSTFRGKYVYIDLWASWCVPCLKEVPVLQKLEKELKNDKVVFLSISIDAKEDAWKKKMQEKNMHGNQLWNPENTLGQTLNVKGIPFFAIYDPEGKLYMHGAPRPSQGPGLVKLLEGLK